MEDHETVRQRLEMDGRLALFSEAAKAGVPEGGWLRAIRRSLNMTLAQLGGRLGKTAATVREIEQREADGSITLGKLAEAGEALDLDLVYGFSPRGGSLAWFVTQRAYKVAGTIVRAGAPPKLLKLDRMGGTRLRMMIEQKMEELRREVPRSLWDDPIKKPRAYRPGPYDRWTYRKPGERW